MNVRLLLLLLVFPLLWLAGCKPGRPDGVLSADKLEDVLYDYHLAMSLVAGRNASADMEVETYAAEEAVFRRHGISREQFEQSLRYYTAHADEMYDIYDHLALRYGAAPAVESSAAVSADAVRDCWPAGDCWLLVSPGVSRRAFEIEADTTFRPGDELTWDFSTAWFYKDGERRAVASLTLHYENDSTATTLQYIYASGRQTLTLRTDSRLRLQKITGFIYQIAPAHGPQRLLEVSGIGLFVRRLAPEVEPVEPSALADTLSAPSDTSAVPTAVGLRRALPPSDGRRPLQERQLAAPESPMPLLRDNVRPQRRQTREQVIRDSLLEADRRRGVVNRSRR